MMFVAWNVRGLNDPIKIKEVKAFVQHQNAYCYALFETRVRSNKVEKIQRKFGDYRKWSSNYDFHRRGRILFGWRPGEIKVVKLIVSEECMTMQVTIGSYEFIVVAVYGLHTITYRKELSRELSNIIEAYIGPMII